MVGWKGSWCSLSWEELEDWSKRRRKRKRRGAKSKGWRRKRKADAGGAQIRRMREGERSLQMRKGNKNIRGGAVRWIKKKKQKINDNKVTKLHHMMSSNSSCHPYWSASNCLLSETTNRSIITVFTEHNCHSLWAPRTNWELNEVVQWASGQVHESVSLTNSPHPLIWLHQSNETPPLTLPTERSITDQSLVTDNWKKKKSLWMEL